MQRHVFYVDINLRFAFDFQTETEFSENRSSEAGMTSRTAQNAESAELLADGDLFADYVHLCIDCVAPAHFACAQCERTEKIGKKKIAFFPLLNPRAVAFRFRLCLAQQTSLSSAAIGPTSGPTTPSGFATALCCTK
jgi:hypothetical protein